LQPAEHEGQATVGGLAVVTGAGHGIGTVIADRLGADGFAVGCLDIDGVAASGRASLIRDRGQVAVGRRCDVRDTAEVRAVMESLVNEFGPIHAVVNNAMSWAPTGPVLGIDELQWHADIAMLLGSYRTVTAGANSHLAAGSSVVMISSVHGLFGSAGWGSYAVAKAGIIQLARVLASELGPRGIRVNAVAPGIIAHSDGLEKYVGRPDLLQQHVVASPLRRTGTAEDVAGAVSFLVGRDSTWITGQTITVDGGMTSVLQLTELELYSGIWPDGAWPPQPQNSP
jgi:NAD(P)-dependent dehydrogenase (short-subunit alcohol dehydrogenase family)